MEVLQSYQTIIEEHGIAYRISEPWLVVGDIPENPVWELYVSPRNSEMVSVLEKLLPVFKIKKLAFRLIQDSADQFKLNGGGFGYDAVGSSITLFPNSESEIKVLLQALEPLLENYSGPKSSGAWRLGEIIYLRGPRLPKSINVPREYRKSTQVPKMAGRWYIHREILHATPKARIFKSINLKKGRFDWCVVKQGSAHMAEDHQGRDISDRIAWERTVLTDLHGKIPAPKLLDFFQAHGDSFLVMEFIDATPLWKKRNEICNGVFWEHLQRQKKEKIISFFLSTLNVIANLHALGYVHRDITDGNFLVGKNDEITIIDFEICYDVNASYPDPAFILGTYGFVSPEQMDLKIPTVAEDIYSLGALLLALITGVNPKLLTKPVQSLPVEINILNLICSCMDFDPSRRPTIGEIRKSVVSILSCLNQTRHEKEPAY